MKEYTSYDPYGTYETKGEEDPYSILMKMSSWNKAIRTTISDVQETLNGTIERQSQIIQEIDKIELNVMDITTELDDTVVRVGKIEVRSDQIELSVSHLDSRLGTAEADIKINAGQIALKASSDSVTALGRRVSTAEININGLQGEIVLKASTASVDSLGRRMNTAEININAQAGQISQKVSTTDYNGRTITSLINQDPYAVRIYASKIDLYGAVTVLSDITGNLGSITAGTIYGVTLNSITVNSAYINISDDIYVGNNIYLGRYSGGYKSLVFADTVSIRSDGYGLSLSSVTGTTIENASFVGTSVDFSGVSRINWGSNEPGGSSATTVRYSSTSRRLYVDQYGSQVGWINLDG